MITFCCNNNNSCGTKHVDTDICVEIKRHTKIVKVTLLTNNGKILFGQ